MLGALRATRFWRGARRVRLVMPSLTPFHFFGALAFVFFFKPPAWTAR